MTKYKVRVITTKYWRPGENHLREILRSVQGKVADGDFVVVSEKAVSTASNNIVDESAVPASFGSKLIAKYWMRVAWGYFLGPLCHFRERLIQRLRNYPLDVGSRHKQVAFKHVGLLQALMFGSEGGIDGSNLAYSYVSLPLKNADQVARRIHEEIRLNLKRNVAVMISDTDKTYSFRGFHFTPRPNPLRGIHSFGGFVPYVVGRMLKFRKRATPLAVAGCSLPLEHALEIAEVANRARGVGAGRTVWDMAERFGVGLDSVSWEMLETVKHKPIVIVRRSER